jgi:pyruvate,orthophosphate dikinase
VAAEGVDVQPEVMIPLVGARRELANQAKIVRGVAAAVFQEQGREVKYAVGTMIEVPRGAIRADEIAKEAEFFSFGTNDLTQTTYGISRDDVGPVLTSYLQHDIDEVDPFVSIDRGGVGVLMRWAVERGRATRPQIKLGICGEHGGDPKSVEFCHEIGLDYVSCSPFRLPIARLAAAQAAVRELPAEKPGKPAKLAKPAKIAKPAKVAKPAKAKPARKSVDRRRAAGGARYRKVPGRTKSHARV